MTRALVTAGPLVAVTEDEVSALGDAEAATPTNPEEDAAATPGPPGNRGLPGGAGTVFLWEEQADMDRQVLSVRNLRTLILRLEKETHQVNCLQQFVHLS